MDNATDTPRRRNRRNPQNRDIARLTNRGRSSAQSATPVTAPIDASLQEEKGAADVIDESDVPIQQSNIITLSLGHVPAAPQASNTVIYVGDITPSGLVPVSTMQPVTPFILQARNFQEFRVGSLDVKVEPLFPMSTSAIMSVFVLPNGASQPSDMSVTAISCLQYRQQGPGNKPLRLVVPGSVFCTRNDGWQDSGVSDDKNQPARLYVVQHAPAVNPFTGNVFDGPYIMLDVRMCVAFRGMSSQTLVVQQTTVKGSATFGENGGKMTLKSTGLREFEVMCMPNSTRERGNTGVGNVLIEVARAALEIGGTLAPPPFSWFCNIGSWFLRRVTAGKGDAEYFVYSSRMDAALDQGISVAPGALATTLMSLTVKHSADTGNLPPGMSNLPTPLSIASPDQFFPNTGIVFKFKGRAGYTVAGVSHPVDGVYTYTYPGAFAGFMDAEQAPVTPLPGECNFGYVVEPGTVVTPGRLTACGVGLLSNQAKGKSERPTIVILFPEEVIVFSTDKQSQMTLWKCQGATPTNSVPLLALRNPVAVSDFMSTCVDDKATKYDFVRFGTIVMRASKMLWVTDLAVTNTLVQDADEFWDQWGSVSSLTGCLTQTAEGPKGMLAGQLVDTLGHERITSCGVVSFTGSTWKDQLLSYHGPAGQAAANAAFVDCIVNSTVQLLEYDNPVRRTLKRECAPDVGACAPLVEEDGFRATASVAWGSMHEPDLAYHRNLAEEFAAMKVERGLQQEIDRVNAAGWNAFQADVALRGVDPDKRLPRPRNVKIDPRSIKRSPRGPLPAGQYQLPASMALPQSYWFADLEDDVPTEHRHELFTNLSAFAQTVRRTPRDQIPDFILADEPELHTSSTQL